MNTQADDRTIIAVTGRDRVKFLQGLVTNDVPEVEGKLVYAALLTPQGKYLADFFMLDQSDTMLLDVAETFADGLIQRLNMYRLRADVLIERSDIQVQRGIGEKPDGALSDPRHPALGWRRYGNEMFDDSIDWDKIHVTHTIPQTGVELLPNETFILEAGFERLNGVDFKKGCYVGQEVTARMKHKTELQKGLAPVSVAGAAAVGTEIIANGKAAGVLYSQSQGKGIAYLRYARAGANMKAGDAIVTYKISDQTKHPDVSN